MMPKPSVLQSTTRGFTDEVFKVQFTKAVTIVMALFQKQESCLSNKATTMCSCPSDSLRSTTGLHSRGGRTTENKVLLVPPTMCRLTLCHGNWIEIQHLHDYIEQLQAVLEQHGIDIPPEY